MAKPPQSDTVQIPIGDFWKSPKFYLPLALFVVCLLIFGRIVVADFLFLDDDRHIFDNPYVANPSWRNIKVLWKNPYFGLYIPVMYSTWSLEGAIAILFKGERAVHQIGPPIFHGTKLIWHGFNIIFLFFVIRILLKRFGPAIDESKKVFGLSPIDKAAFAGAALFGFHPVQVGAVAWLSATKDVLATFFMCFSIWQYWKYLTAKFGDIQATVSNKKKRKGKAKSKPGMAAWHISWALFWFAVSMLTKPSVVMLPGLLAFFNLVFLKEKAKRTLGGLLLFFASVIPVIMITKRLQPNIGLEFVPPLWMRPLIAGDSLYFYILKILFPASLTPDYGRTPSFVVEHGWHYWHWILPTVLLAIIWKYRKKTPLVYLGTAVFIFALSPVLGFIPFEFQSISSVADHYLYVSMAGLGIILAYFLIQFPKPAVFIATGVFLTAYAVRAGFQVPVWKTSHRIFSHVLKFTPQSYLAHNNYAKALIYSNDLEKGKHHLLESLKYNPGYLPAQTNLGAVYFLQGDYQGAINHYKKYIQINSTGPKSRDARVGDMNYNLGLCYEKTNRPDLAVRHYQQALVTNPLSIGSYERLASLLIRFGRLQEAEKYLLRGLRLEPHHKIMKMHMARIQKMKAGR